MKSKNVLFGRGEKKQQFAKATSMLAIAVAFSALSGMADATGVEVMHGWTSGSESFALQSVKDALAKQKIGWKDSAIAGAGGANAQQALQARLAAGNAPVAAQAFPQLIVAYKKQGSLDSLDAYAKAGNWDAHLSPEMRTYAKVDGSYYAAPITEHRENMLWINKKVLAKYGDKAPANWQEFNALAARMKKDGIIPLALGGEDWQEAEVFSAILLGQAGKDFWKKAIIKRDPTALQSDTMRKAFDEFRTVLSFTDKNRAGRDWNVATQMVIDGKAAMQVQGDWAKGEFLRANKKPGTDFLCVTTPGSGRDFVFVTDMFVFFKQSNSDAKANQRLFASTVMNKDIQETFNLRKGSISPFVDVNQSKFDDCAKQAYADRAANQKNGGMLPSFIENISQPRDVRGAFVDVITHFANSPAQTSQEAVNKLAQALKNL